MKRRLGETVYFKGEAMGTIVRIQFVEGISSVILHDEEIPDPTALKITLADGTSFFEPLRPSIDHNDSA